MLKKYILPIIAVFAAYSLMDMLLHGVILMNIYSDYPTLWRPMEEMKMWIQYMVVLFSSFSFVLIYTKLINPKSFKNAIIYGLLWGFSAGTSMGYGTYSVMPIPYALAAGWFWGVLVEAAVSGMIVGLMIKD